MQVVQTLESVSLNTDDFLMFRYFQDLIRKNFSKVIGNKNKTLSFFVENEIPQRRYFLKLVNHKYKKDTGNDIDNLAFAHYKTFKLNLAQANTLKPVIFAKIGFAQRSILITLSSNEKIFAVYLEQYFKNHKSSYDEKNCIFSVDYKDDMTLNLLEILASVNEHLKYCVDFTINETQLLEFRNKMKNKTNTNWKFNALAKLFENYFQTLGCNNNDDFATIRQNYLNLVKIYHPDRHQGKSKIEQAYCREEFEKIQLAYESLKSLYKNNS
ncbi:adenylosuccinate lyase [Campylobacter insulaenigrae]|uniref:adenylosuccinate lyase n=1 Tax=Campylobacter insulaenigrae TaxID=260714 RepID=UPI000F6F8EF5|nr:adenylosuccinate lyase [Campylobacter insulaenigrae]MCR6591224.1 adenylosuccinate lyase [Campylobacter insulaenigrae]MCR6592642.1 adenylosuccinate lyase [Campylobacter insulaenigrae]VEJ53110.1 adenylosuccinate lyase [Campylobacter insulaenigrae]